MASQTKAVSMDTVRAVTCSVCYEGRANRFSSLLDVGYERKGGVQNDARFFQQVVQKVGLSSAEMEKAMSGSV